MTESMTESLTSFNQRLLAWHAEHGRHDLPWTRQRSPYTVWLAEIMLQQTQVATVIPYFERFTRTYPSIAALAAADLDAVLHLWTGLGYYSRARNLHAAARLIVKRHGGELPRDLDALMGLPGIGRSTAGAILAQAFELPHAILDGNVKRVLARYHGVDGYPGDSAVANQLWQLSESHVPLERARDYTQAVMDFGATLCTRAQPRCSDCPLAQDCRALADERQHELPARRRSRTTPTRETIFLVIENAERSVLLEQRPPSGVWGGLWCFPEIADDSELTARIAGLGCGDVEHIGQLAPFTHTFTHFKLAIRAQRLRATVMPGEVREHDNLLWYKSTDSTRIGLSAPVVRLLQSLEQIK
jgi:A/G-specific adenine glycosylase